MREIANLLNEMRDAGLISNYAIFGAIAQMRYTAPVATIDVDVLVAVPDPDRLDVLAPVVRADYLAAIALSVGRGKDYARILSLLESGHATRDAVARIARRFGLAPSWAAFEERFFHD